MNNPKKIMLRILLIISAFLLLIFGLIIFLIKKNGITEFDEKNNTEPILTKTEKVTPDLERGKKLFTNDCNTCHKERSIINKQRISKMIKDNGVDYFKIFINNQDSLTNAKDIYQNKIKEEYGNLANSHNLNYSETELKELIEYLETE